MDAQEIEALVKSGAEMPDDLNIGDLCYFLSLDYIWRVKRTREEKKHLYRDARESYEEFRREAALFQDTCQMRVKLAAVSRDMIVHGCPLCKKAIAIFDGREKEGT